jgi:hypothetical protein
MLPLWSKIPLARGRLHAKRWCEPSLPPRAAWTGGTRVYATPPAPFLPRARLLGRRPPPWRGLPRAPGTLTEKVAGVHSPIRWTHRQHARQCAHLGVLAGGKRGSPRIGECSAARDRAGRRDGPRHANHPRACVHGAREPDLWPEAAAWGSLRRNQKSPWLQAARMIRRPAAIPPGARNQAATTMMRSPTSRAA